MLGNQGPCCCLGRARGERVYGEAAVRPLARGATSATSTRQALGRATTKSKRIGKTLVATFVRSYRSGHASSASSTPTGRACGPMVVVSSSS